MIEEFGALLPEVRVPPPGPRSLEFAHRLREVESPDVTFLGPEFPVFWEEARGANVRDVDGNVYLDATGGFGVSLLGHAPRGVRNALHGQADVLLHGMGDVHPPRLKVVLLERLAEVAPWAESRAVLASSGSESVEAALKTAVVATGKPGVVAFRGAYHGLTLGSLAATGREHFRGPFRDRLFPDVHFLDFPTESAEAAAVLEELDGLLEVGRVGDSELGALILEPIQGRAGVRIPPDDFLVAVVERCRAAGVVTVFDEIFTGLGRAGGLFYGPSVGAVPDLICIGKALGGGMPISACLGSAEVMDRWPDSTGEAVHTSTFLGHPLSCGSALAFLHELEESGGVARARKLGAELMTGLAAALGDHPAVVEVRGRGLMIGLELEGEAGVGARVAVEALRRGVLLLPAGEEGRVVELTPPTCLTRAQSEALVELTSDAVRALVGEE